MTVNKNNNNKSYCTGTYRKYYYAVNNAKGLWRLSKFYASEIESNTFFNVSKIVSDGSEVLIVYYSSNLIVII